MGCSHVHSCRFMFVSVHERNDILKQYLHNGKGLLLQLSKFIDLIKSSLWTLKKRQRHITVTSLHINRQVSLLTSPLPPPAHSPHKAAAPRRLYLLWKRKTRTGASSVFFSFLTKPKTKNLSSKSSTRLSFYVVNINMWFMRRRKVPILSFFPP